MFVAKYSVWFLNEVSEDVFINELNVKLSKSDKAKLKKVEQSVELKSEQSIVMTDTFLILSFVLTAGLSEVSRFSTASAVKRPSLKNKEVHFGRERFVIYTGNRG